MWILNWHTLRLGCLWFTKLLSQTLAILCFKNKWNNSHLVLPCTVQENDLWCGWKNHSKPWGVIYVETCKVQYSVSWVQSVMIRKKKKTILERINCTSIDRLTHKNLKTNDAIMVMVKNNANSPFRPIIQVQVVLKMWALHQSVAVWLYWGVYWTERMEVKWPCQVTQGGFTQYYHIT